MDEIRLVARIVDDQSVMVVRAESKFGNLADVLASLRSKPGSVTFGHNGAGGQIAWADPESGISFAYVTNGLDAHVIRQGRRGIALSSLAAIC